MIRGLAALLLALLAACATGQAGKRPTTILFIGNSQVYVGNLPAVFDAMSDAAGRPTHSDMIVAGGATLKERVDDGTVERALEARHYDFVVLQERGGELVCAFSPDSCAESAAAIATLGRTIRAHGARPLLLGTYQKLPRASDALLDSEGAAAKDAGMPYIAVSGRLAKGKATVPDAAWMHADGAHPGHDLILLDAVLLYTRMFGQAPPAFGFRVAAPMYEPSAHFLPPAPTTPGLRAPDIPVGYDYTTQSVADVLSIASGA